MVGMTEAMNFRKSTMYLQAGLTVRLDELPLKIAAARYIAHSCTVSWLPFFSAIAIRCCMVSECLQG